MSEMVGRVATAIRDEWNAGIDSLWDQLRGEDAERLARVAIASMRDPTFEMMMVSSGGCVGGIWEAQIDEALKD